MNWRHTCSSTWRIKGPTSRKRRRHSLGGSKSLGPVLHYGNFSSGWHLYDHKAFCFWPYIVDIRKSVQRQVGSCVCGREQATWLAQLEVARNADRHQTIVGINIEDFVSIWTPSRMG